MDKPLLFIITSKRPCLGQYPICLGQENCLFPFKVLCRPVKPKVDFHTLAVSSVLTVIGRLQPEQFRVVIVNGGKNRPKLGRRHILHRRKCLKKVIGICIDLTVHVLSLFVKHSIIRIIDRVKDKPVPGISLTDLGKKLVSRLVPDLASLILNFLITVLPRYLIGYQHICLIRCDILRADIAYKPFLPGLCISRSLSGLISLPFCACCSCHGLPAVFRVKLTPAWRVIFRFPLPRMNFPAAGRRTCLDRTVSRNFHPFPVRIYQISYCFRQIRP